MRLLPSPGVTRLQWYYEPLRRPRRPTPAVSLCAATARRARASHVAPDNRADVPFPLPRWTAMIASVGASPSRGGLPLVSAESASTARTFEACSGFTRVTARGLARRTSVRLVSPRLQLEWLPTLAARIATELYRHVLGWDLHPLVLCAFVAHANGQRSPAATHNRTSGRLVQRVLDVTARSCHYTTRRFANSSRTAGTRSTGTSIAVCVVDS